jgi:hypothetical protein
LFFRRRKSQNCSNPAALWDHDKKRLKYEKELIQIKEERERKSA